jgi:hypothetical protein
MTTERDTRMRIVLSWLREDAHENAERMLLRALDEVDATPQRRSFWPAWRLPNMNNPVRIAIAAAAVLVVALAGYQFLPRNTGGVGGVPTRSPAQSAAATTPASLLPSASPLALMPNGKIPPGTYRKLGSSNTPFSVTVPAGWTHEANQDNFISKGAVVAADVFAGNGVAFATWTVSHVYADSCNWQGTLQPVGTAAEIVDRLASQTGHGTSGPTATAIGGHEAKAFVFTVAKGFPIATCDLSLIRLWPDAGPNENYGLPISPGQTTTVYVVEVNGKATLVIKIRNQDSTPADVAELESIIDSMTIDE